MLDNSIRYVKLAFDFQTYFLGQSAYMGIYTYMEEYRLHWRFA